MDIVQLICLPFSYIVSSVNSWTGSYLLALLAFTIIMKVVLFPLSIKQQKNSVRQAKLRPREEAIRAKYAGRTDKRTQQKLQQEIMTMYQEEKFSPAAGCLPLLIQLPLLIILYNIVIAPMAYTAHYTAQETTYLNISTAIGDYYDYRYNMEGSQKDEFSLERTEGGNYIFRDPATGLDNLVKVQWLQIDGNGDEYFVFYEETEDGKFSKTPLAFDVDAMKTRKYVEVAPGAEGSVNGIVYRSIKLDRETALVTPLRKNQKLFADAATPEEELPAYNYAEIYDTLIVGKGDLRTSEELNLLGNLPEFELFGGAIDLSKVAGEAGGWLYLIPALTFITSYLSQWLTRKFTYQPQTTAESQGSMRMMNVMMPLLSVFIAFTVPAALAVYWVMQNLVSPVQQMILAKCWPVPKYTDDELKKLKQEYLAKQKGRVDKKSIPAPKHRSLVYDDDEDIPELPAQEPKAAPQSEREDSDSPIGKADLK